MGSVKKIFVPQKSKDFLLPDYSLIKKTIGKEPGFGVDKLVNVETPEVQPIISTDTEQVTEAARREAERLRKRRGYAGTIKTSGLGLLGQPSTLKTTLG